MDIITLIIVLAVIFNPFCLQWLFFRCKTMVSLFPTYINMSISQRYQNYICVECNEVTKEIIEIQFSYSLSYCRVKRIANITEWNNIDMERTSKLRQFEIVKFYSSWMRCLVCILCLFFLILLNIPVWFLIIQGLS